MVLFERMRGVEDEVRFVMVFFVDIVGLMVFGECLLLEEVKVFVGECVICVSGVVEEFGGIV